MVKDWEIITDRLSKAGWSLGWVSAIDRNRRPIWIADAHRDEGWRFIVRAVERLTAFVKLESAIPSHGELSCATFHPRHIAKSHEQRGDFKEW